MQLRVQKHYIQFTLKYILFNCIFTISTLFFLHIMDFIGNQTVQGPNESFSAASKSFKRHQTMSDDTWTLRVMT